MSAAGDAVDLVDLVDLVVVGAGIAGLSHAWRAARAGRDVLVLEAAPRVGGVIRTDRVGGYRVERAAASFPSTAEHLFDVHGSLPAPPPVRTARPEANRQMLLTKRGLVFLPKPGPGLITSPILPALAKVRAIAEVLRGPRRVSTPETAYAFARRRFGRAVAERLLRPFTLGVYGTDPNDLGYADAWPVLAEMERNSGGLIRAMIAKRREKKGGPRRTLCAFEDGMEAFPRAIAEALGDRVRTGVRVDSLRTDPDPNSVDGTGSERVVVLRCSDGVERRAREVCLSTPAYDQARLVEPLSPSAADVLRAVRYGPMVVAAVGVPPGGAPPLPPAFGFLRAPGARVRILGASFPSVLNPAVAPEGHSLVTAFIGGGRDPSAIDLSDAEVRATVEGDLSRALRAPVRPDVVDVCRWPRAIPVLSPGHRARMASAQALLAPHGVRLWGSHVSGVGVHNCTAPMP